MPDIHAVLLSLTQSTVGDAFDVSRNPGVTTISLYDVSDFDEDGGQVSIAGTVYTYDSVDMDADTIHLTTGLVAAVAADTAANLWDPDYAVPVTEYTALVTVDGQADGDPLTVDIDHSLSTLLSAGTFAAGQSVSITQDGDTYTLTKVHGKNNLGTQRTDSGGLKYGTDLGNGTLAGIQTSPGGATVRLTATTDARAKTPDSVSFIPMLASAFTVSSDPAVKTRPTPPPDALDIIRNAPASHWRYLTDNPDVVRLGPMADALPAWLVQEDPEDGHKMLDLARENGVLWRAVEQLLDRIERLEES